MLDPERWCEPFNRVATAILDGIAHHGPRCGNPLGVASPGFMTGLAGIGYQLLRLAEPARVPSVLTLAPPVT
jgi:lantibiotic modifying enzyme